MRVADVKVKPHRLAQLDRLFRGRNDLVIEGACQSVVLLLATKTRDFGGHPRLIENAREIETARLPMLDAFAHVEQFGMADHFIERSESELRHQFSHFL